MNLRNKDDDNHQSRRNMSIWITVKGTQYTTESITIMF